MASGLPRAAQAGSAADPGSGPLQRSIRSSYQSSVAFAMASTVSALWSLPSLELASVSVWPNFSNSGHGPSLVPCHSIFPTNYGR